MGSDPELCSGSTFTRTYSLLCIVCFCWFHDVAAVHLAVEPSLLLARRSGTHCQCPMNCQRTRATDSRPPWKLSQWLKWSYRGAGRVSGQDGQNSARSAKKHFSFAHPGFQFAHPAIRNGCPPWPPYRGDLREKASLATNQKGPPPLLSVWPSLTVRPSYTHAWSMTTGKR